jgi:hypothetical protein
VTEIIENSVGIGQRPACHLATHLACRGHGQHFAQILPSANSGGLNANFSAGHRNGREAKWFGRKANDQQYAGRTNTGKRGIVGGFRGGSY